MSKLKAELGTLREEKLELIGKSYNLESENYKLEDALAEKDKNYKCFVEDAEEKIEYLKREVRRLRNSDNSTRYVVYYTLN